LFLSDVKYKFLQVGPDQSSDLTRKICMDSFPPIGAYAWPQEIELTMAMHMSTIGDESIRSRIY
jgi:hypothetical protein